ncbi:MAG: hypothetical protein HDQ88_05660 [Clostridia bacterium]|nr:hypothetical protein [Clostridia bacterium]
MNVVLSSFGGIMPRLAEHKLAPNQATMAHDVKLRNGQLEAWREPKLFGEAVQDARSFHISGCCLVSWHDRVSVADLSPDWGRFYMVGSDGNLRSVVIDCECRPSTTLVGVPVPVTQPVASANEQCSREADARAYVYTYVNEWGEESAPSPASNIVRVDDGSVVSVRINDAVPMGYGIIGRHLYRASTGFRPADGKVQKPLTEYLFVASIPVEQRTFTDNIKGIYLGAALETQYDRQPPNPLSGIVSIGDQVRLAGFHQNRVYFSEQFQPHNWPAKYDLTLDHNIVNMGCLDQKLFVTTNGIPYVIDVSSCDDTKCTPVTSLEAPLPDIGCKYAHSGITTPHGFIYSSPVGLVLLQPDGRWHIVTAKWFGKDEWQKLMPDTVRLTYWEGYLFIVTDMASFLLNLNGQPYGDMEGAELSTISDAPIDMLSTPAGGMFFLEDDKVYVWDAGASYRPFIWRSRPLTSGPDAAGQGRLESQNPARGAYWWPTSVKIGTKMTRFILIGSHGNVLHDRSVFSEQPVRLPRAGRHMWYKVELRGTEVVEFLDMGTSNMSVNQGM